MRASAFLFRIVRFLLPLSILFTIYVYYYPFFKQCGFLSPTANAQRCHENGGHDCSRDNHPPSEAPFRLLALGDPQLEGDSSLPEQAQNPLEALQKIWRDALEGEAMTTTATNMFSALRKTVSHDLPLQLRTWRKELDLFGNDFYLAHIYRTLHWWTNPTHVSVLGDLLGSQWITDEEFSRRASRYWDRVFKHGLPIGEDISAREGDSAIEILGHDRLWRQRIINIAGNHDIGYAGDIDEDRVARFERAFGQVNWDVKFQLHNATLRAPVDGQSLTGPPTLHVVVLNSMNIDGPVHSQGLQLETYDFINGVIGRMHPVEEHTSATVVLTHIPLHKAEGICVDGPMFTYFGDGNGIQEQNHLSDGASKQVLEGIFGLSANREAANQGMGRKGVIVNGHDHEGCDTWHSIEYGAEKWNATRYEEAINMPARHDRPGLREITLRSMMGEYGGYAGLLSAWFDELSQEWIFDFQTCSIGVQHWWWAAHILDAITVAFILFASVLRFIELPRSGQTSPKATKSERKAAFKHD